MTARVPAPLLGVIALGGALGGLARYGLALAFPAPDGGFPWATFATNVTGCLLIGTLLAVLTEADGHPHPWVRPFLGVGLLGGYTTFSTYAVETVTLVEGGAVGPAVLYAAGTLVAAVVAVHAGAAGTRLVARRRRTAPC